MVGEVVVICTDSQYSVVSSVLDCEVPGGVVSDRIEVAGGVVSEGGCWQSGV